MLTKEHVQTLGAVCAAISQKQCTEADVLRLRELADEISYQLACQSERDEKYQALQQIGRSAAESLADMVAALECDYDRLEELRAERDEHNARHAEGNEQATREDQAIPNYVEELAELERAAGDCESRDDAEQRIQEDPLCIELAGKWSIGETPTADRALILLGTGGPATRIVCELDENMEPHRAWIEAQDWFTQWTEYHGDAISSDALLAYCRCFYYGEG